MKSGTEQEMAGLFTKLVLQADLSKLSEVELVQYYHAVCQRAGLDPMTKPFEVLVLNGRKTLYATKTAAAQLTAIHGVSVNIVDKGKLGEDTYYAQARVVKKDGTTVDDIGVVNIANVRGEGLSNAIMKAVTKAKRRAILSAFGIGLNDESEMQDVQGVTMHRDAIDPTLVDIDDEVQNTIEDFAALFDGTTSCEEMNHYLALIKKQPDATKTYLRNSTRVQAAITSARQRLNLVWNGTAYTVNVQESGNDE